MTDQVVQRRLAAILAVDVASYTRLMEEDTDGTVAAWKAARVNVIEPEIADKSAHIIKFTGDGFLAEFSSVQDAVNCAIDLQLGLASNALDFRMGIHLGDIVDDGNDVHGEGVNIAARIEALAEPGGICISSGIYEQVRHRVDAKYDDMGEQQLKNVSAPVRTYAVRFGTPQSVSSTEPAPDTTQPTNISPELPDKPSIAVLPFDNMSGDPEQEYFADGMTEDLITDLSKVSGLFVVARNSSFAFKGKATDIRSVASKLGVHYVLEGSIRKMGNRIRINAQLIDAVSGGHLWADRYDGSIDSAFELQDDVGAKVVSALSVQLSSGEADNLKRVHTHNIDAYSLFVRARATPYPPIPERIKMAREMFEQVIEMDPEFAGGYAGVSTMLSFAAIWGHGDASEAIERAISMAQKGISLDDSFGWSYTALAQALLCKNQHAEAIAAAQEAISHQPNDADAHAYFGLLQGLNGDFDEGVNSINQALRLNPQFFNGPYLNIRGQTHVLAEDYDLAIETHHENIGRQGPVGPPALCWVAASYMGLERQQEAAKMVNRLRKDFPAFTMTNWNYPKLIRDDDVRNRVINLMQKAGVP